MNDLLDEETLAVTASLGASEADGASQNVRLSNANTLKNHARFNIAQQKGQLFDNNILKASSSLLSLVVSIKRLQCPEDMFTFRNGIKGALTDLKYKIAKLDYPPSIADKTCFLFAVMLDEQILHSPWGEESGWENQTLVSELFGIKNGGEQFYLVTERALLQPVLLADLLELIYVMIKMGFRGRYRVNGKEQLDILMQRIEEAVFVQGREQTEVERLVNIEPDSAIVNKAARPRKPVRLWHSFFAFAVLTGIAWAGIDYWYAVTSPQKAQAFINLPQFTEQYFQQAGVQDKEYVYQSTPEEMQASRATYGNNNLVAIEGEWELQLALFKSRSRAENFVAKYRDILPTAAVIEWRNQYRVAATSDSRESIEQALNAAHAAGITDAYIVSDK